MDEGLNNDDLYYFTCLHQEKYYNLFIGWLREEIVESFKDFKEGQGFVYMKVNVGEITFINEVDKPLYLFNYENDDIFEFAGDDNELNIFPSGKVPPDADFDPVIDYPSYFTKDAAHMAEYKITNRLFKQVGGFWVPVDL